MYIHVRYWLESDGGGLSKTRYFDSQFMGRASVKDLLKCFRKSSCELNLRYISMDGPNVN
jgi:hypothetical protein